MKNKIPRIKHTANPNNRSFQVKLGKQLLSSSFESVVLKKKKFEDIFFI